MWEELGSKPYRPWIRMRLWGFLELWSRRPFRMIPSRWLGVTEIDRDKLDKVQWWLPMPTVHNETTRERLRAKLAGEEDLEELADDDIPGHILAANIRCWYDRGKPTLV